MKELIALFTLISVCATAVADDYVRGYTRKDGTYVEPHHRTNPNSRRDDNYSSKGNQNPYTNERGYKGNEDNNSSYNQNQRRRSSW